MVGAALAKLTVDLDATSDSAFAKRLTRSLPTVPAELPRTTSVGSALAVALVIAVCQLSCSLQNF